MGYEDITSGIREVSASIAASKAGPVVATSSSAGYSFMLWFEKNGNTVSVCIAILASLISLWWAYRQDKARRSRDREYAKYKAEEHRLQMEVYQAELDRIRNG